MSKERLRYRAFISYSQRDKRFAKRLHRTLEKYRVPIGIEADLGPQRRLGRFFRDDDELGASSNLGAALEGAIDDAENLIVVCSPNSAKSKWVNEEVLHFRRMGRCSSVFAIVIDGQPNSGSEKTECFPPALRDRSEPEPLGLDVRKDSYSRLIARLVAGLLKKNFDDFWKREKRVLRVRLMRRFALMVGIVVVGGTLAESARWLVRNNYPLEALPLRWSSWIGRYHLPGLVKIPSGQFFMGGEYGDPGKWVTIPRTFYLGQTEVTFEQFDSLAVTIGLEWIADQSWGRGTQPAINVSWDDASAYTQRLGDVTGATCRLPNEAEWEYAARATTKTPYALRQSSTDAWGTDDLRGLASCADCGPSESLTNEENELVGQRTLPVGSFQPNAWGLYDMHGNVWEWVEDCVHDNYPSRPDDGNAWLEENGGQCSSRVLRGGSWTYERDGATSGTRSRLNRDARDLGLGFRVVCSSPIN